MMRPHDLLQENGSDGATGKYCMIGTLTFIVMCKAIHVLLLGFRLSMPARPSPASFLSGLSYSEAV